MYFHLIYLAGKRGPRLRFLQRQFQPRRPRHQASDQFRLTVLPDSFCPWQQDNKTIAYLGIVLLAKCIKPTTNIVPRAKLPLYSCHSREKYATKIKVDFFQEKLAICFKPNYCRSTKICAFFKIFCSDNTIQRPLFPRKDTENFDSCGNQKWIIGLLRKQGNKQTFDRLS